MRERKPSRKQAAILSVLRQNATLTLEEATWLVGRDVYHNQRKYTGAILANMVKRGLIQRVKPGVFAIEKFGGSASAELIAPSPGGQSQKTRFCGKTSGGGKLSNQR